MESFLFYGFLPPLIWSKRFGWLEFLHNMQLFHKSSVSWSLKPAHCACFRDAGSALVRREVQISAQNTVILSRDVLWSLKPAHCAGFVDSLQFADKDKDKETDEHVLIRFFVYLIAVRGSLAADRAEPLAHLDLQADLQVAPGLKRIVFGQQHDGRSELEVGEVVALRHLP